MEVVLPIPIFYKDNIYRQVEIKAPNLGTLVEVKKIEGRGAPFSAMLELCKRCILKIDDIEDKGLISSVMQYVPFRSVEVLVHKIAYLFNSEDEDGIEGLYKCPLCKNMIRAELGDGYDTRDFLSQLEINYYEGSENLITIEFANPVTLTERDSRDVTINTITSIGMRFVTINDCIKYESLPSNDMDISIHAECVTHINNIYQEKKNVIVNSKIIKKINDSKTSKSLINAIRQYGLDNTFEKVCNKCGKKFRVVPETSNFFDQALQAV